MKETCIQKKSDKKGDSTRELYAIHHKNRMKMKV